VTEALGVVIGLIGGMVLLGLGVYLYFILRTVGVLTAQLKELIATITPIFSSAEVLRGFKSFSLLAEQGEQIGRKIESLDGTIQGFYKFAFRTPVAGAAMGAEESIAVPYDEEARADREISDKLRRKGVETDAGRVSQADSEKITHSDTPVF
jgi:hypothetical protein